MGSNGIPYPTIPFSLDVLEQGLSGALSQENLGTLGRIVVVAEVLKPDEEPFVMILRSDGRINDLLEHALEARSDEE